MGVFICWTCHVYRQRSARRNVCLSQSYHARTLRARLCTLVQLWRNFTARRELCARVAHTWSFRKQHVNMHYIVGRWRMLQLSSKRNWALSFLHMANIQRKVLRQSLRTWHVVIHKAHKNRHLAQTCLARHCRARKREACRAWYNISKKAKKLVCALETYSEKWNFAHVHMMLHCWICSCIASRRNRRLVLCKRAAKRVTCARRLLVAWRLRCMSWRGRRRISHICVVYKQRERLRDFMRSWLHVCKKACRHANVCQLLLACRQRVRMCESLHQWRHFSHQTRIRNRTARILFFRRQHGHHTCVLETVHAWHATVKRRARARYVTHCITKQRECASVRAALRLWQGLIGAGGCALSGSRASLHGTRVLTSFSTRGETSSSSQGMVQNASYTHRNQISGKHVHVYEMVKGAWCVRQQVLACARLLRRAICGWSLAIRSSRAKRMGQLRLCLAARRRHFTAWKQVLMLFLFTRGMTNIQLSGHDSDTVIKYIHLFDNQVMARIQSSSLYTNQYLTNQYLTLLLFT
jgi:hypothetical protein